jgi:hypothetical protein
MGIVISSETGGALRGNLRRSRVSLEASGAGDISGRSKEWLQVGRDDAHKFEPDQIAVVEVRRPHVTHPRAEGGQVPVRLERDVEFGLRLKRGGSLDERASEADVENLDAALRDKRPRQTSYNLEAGLLATIGHV